MNISANQIEHHHVLPLWRSLLFVPAHQQRFIDRAHTRGADALILDLEDSVPLQEKQGARAGVVSAASCVNLNGADVLVRINANWRLAVRDLEAVISPAIHSVVVPKVSSAEQLQAISEVISELEAEAGMPRGTTGLLAQIESPAALFGIQSIAAADPRLLALSLGSEDFAVEAGMQPNADSLLFPSQQIIFAARAAGILPLGFVASIADYADIEAFGNTIRRASALGFAGGLCIHPAQVPVMNAGYAPSDEDVAEARALLEVYQRAFEQGHGAVEFRGRMIDLPVAERAEELLRTAKIIAVREHSK